MDDVGQHKENDCMFTCIWSTKVMKGVPRRINEHCKFFDTLDHFKQLQHRTYAHFY